MTSWVPERHLWPIAAGYAAGMAAYSRLPGPFLPDGWFVFGRPLIAFLLPTTALAIYLLLWSLWTRDPIRQDNGTLESTYKEIIFRIIVFVTAVHGLILANLLGVAAIRAWAGRGVLIMFGLLLIGVGNLLPRTRPNVGLGVRTWRTLTNRQLWMRTHRLGGHLLVALGSVIVCAGAFLPGSTMPIVVGPSAVVAACVFLVSYRKYVSA